MEMYVCHRKDGDRNWLNIMLKLEKWRGKMPLSVQVSYAQMEGLPTQLELLAVEVALPPEEGFDVLEMVVGREVTEKSKKLT